MEKIGLGSFLKLPMLITMILTFSLGPVISKPFFFGTSGSYLTANFAAGRNDFTKAAESYFHILKSGDYETLIVQEALLYSVLADDFKSSVKLLEATETKNLTLPTMILVSLINHYKKKEFIEVYDLLSKYGEILPTFLVSSVLGWTEIAKGSIEAGISHFNTLDGTSRYLALFNSAVAFAIVGDFQKALPYVEELESQELAFDEKQLEVLVQIYSNNNFNDKALFLLENQGQADGNNFGIFDKTILELKSGKKLKFSAFDKPQDALSSVFYLLGTVGDANRKNPLASNFYIQLAAALSSEKNYYRLRLAENFAEMGAPAYSLKKFNEVTSDSVFHLRARLGAADLLAREGEVDLAKNVLEKLIEDEFNEFLIFESLADIHRLNEDYSKAIDYYDMALSNLSEGSSRSKWATIFVRGICYDQSGNWEKAKLDFKTALELSPNHPEILNYFGYSLIERNEMLEDALGMIENAVSQRPDSGYIIDSLGWGLFRLGFYEKAIGPMEQAIQLEPHDPIVNDHLGDVLWMIGRKREAAFQWQRALLFSPTEENKKKIKKKLKFGITDL